MKECLRAFLGKFVLSFQLGTGSKTVVVRARRIVPKYTIVSTSLKPQYIYSPKHADYGSTQQQPRDEKVASSISFPKLSLSLLGASLCRLVVKHLDLIRATLKIHMCVGVPCLEFGVTPWPKVNGGKGRQLENNSRSKSVSSSSQSTSSTTPNADSP